MELLEKNENKIVFKTSIDIGLANAIRRSVNEVPVLAIDEVDIYRNDTALYDEVVAHRLGLVPLKNQNLKEGEVIEMKLKAKGGEGGTEVLSGELGEDVVYSEMPIVRLEEGQEIELVAKAKTGLGLDHAKHFPGLVYYKHYPKVKISGEGEKQSELAELYPDCFEFDGKLKLKDEWKCELDEEDAKEYKGINIEFGDDLVYYIESWGQMNPEKIFTEACEALKANLKEVSKQLK